MSQILVCKTGDYINCTNMRERAKRASASELGTVYFNEVSYIMLVWTAARPDATIVYITLMIFDIIECFNSLIN